MIKIIRKKRLFEDNTTAPAANTQLTQLLVSTQLAPQQPVLLAAANNPQLTTTNNLNAPVQNNSQQLDNTLLNTLQQISDNNQNTNQTQNTLQQSTATPDYNNVVKGMSLLQFDMLLALGTVFTIDNISKVAPDIAAAAKDPKSPFNSEAVEYGKAVSAFVNALSECKVEDASTFTKAMEAYGNIVKTNLVLSDKIVELTKAASSTELQQLPAQINQFITTNEMYKLSSFGNKLNEKLKQTHFLRILEEIDF